MVVRIALIILPGVSPLWRPCEVDSHKSEVEVQGLEVVCPVLFYRLLSLWRNSATRHLFRANREVTTWAEGSFIVELSRARSARCGASWVKSLVNYLSEKIWLWRSVRPPTRKHTSCKPMSNGKVDLAQASQLCKLSLWVWLDWQLSKSDIRWQLSHEHLAGSDERPVYWLLHISWYNMSHLPIFNIKTKLRRSGLSVGYQ